MNTGVQDIAEERQVKQIEKHGFTAEHHAKNPQWYDKGQMAYAARLLSWPDDSEIRNYYHCPDNWNAKWFSNLIDKPYLRRLAIAGALLASEIDRIKYLEANKGK